MAKSMTGRERVLAAISHQQPDRIPIDLAGTRDSSIVVEGYEKLKNHFGIEAENTLADRMMRVVRVDERILFQRHRCTQGCSTSKTFYYLLNLMNS